MSELKTLIRRRGYQKAQLSKLEGYVKGLDCAEMDIVALHVKLEKLQGMRLAMKELRLEFYQVIDDDKEFDTCEEEFESLEERIDELEIFIRRLVEKKQQSEMALHIKEEGHVQHKDYIRARVKLPEILLPNFSGKYDEWNNFLEQFTDLITDNMELSDMQKLYYLKASLIGEARQVINTDDTFDALMQALQERYSNKRLIADSHVNIILNLRKMSGESSKDLQKLVDKMLQQLRALKQMKLQMNQLSEVILMNVLISKLDNETRKQLEMSLQSTELLSWDCFIGFLQKRCQALEGIERSVNRYRPARFEKPPRTFVTQLSQDHKPHLINKACSYCESKTHNIYDCDNFKQLELCKKYEFLRQKKFCFNCLKPNHTVIGCNLKGCNHCNKKHHTLLHRSERIVAKDIDSSNRLDSSSREQLGMTSLSIVNKNSYVKKHKHVLLSTAIVYLRDSQGCLRTCRALLDSASQSNFITEECVTTLGLKRIRVNIPVSGLNGSIVMIRNAVNTVVTSTCERYEKDINVLVVPKVTGFIPAEPIDISDITIPASLKLADPHFNKPSRIDMILGAEIFFELLKSGKLVLKNNSIVLQESVFGWIVNGSITKEGYEDKENYCHLSSEMVSLDINLRRFWELENIPEDAPIISEEETICEKHFVSTYKRNREGRYVVRLPLNINVHLGCTRRIAERRLQSLWYRLEKDTIMKGLYCEFMDEYERLGHMEKIKDNDDRVIVKSYLPHHGVYRENRRTTKLRVVFDASVISTSGQSFNNLQLNGGVIQDDLFSIILRFRTHKFVLTADIVKMYRQILVDRRQCDLQRILWKKSPNGEVEEYRLLTLTYGTKSAPYLATRVLKQLALDEQKDLPLASAVILNDAYIDDILTGTDSYMEAIELKRQLVEICKRSGMMLHKWCSNNKYLMSDSNDCEEYQFKNEENYTIKTLGLIWNAANDCFRFEHEARRSNYSKYTKRIVLSDIARLFDPLGLLGPVITYAKIFVQELWLLRVDWDQELPLKENKRWSHFVTCLQNLGDCKIERYVGCKEVNKIEIHGYSDASESAYGACIYLRSIKQNNDIVVNLLCSKSRVAPVKKVTMPRLELCGALLLSRLVKRVIISLKRKVDSVHLYSDSSITLYWIKTSSHLLKTFVANRVVMIQELTSLYQWHHIASGDNPADMLSRGILPDKLRKNDLWWHGPTDLRSNIIIPQDKVNLDYKSNKSFAKELKAIKTTNLLIMGNQSCIEGIIRRSSEYLHILRIVAYVLRFCWNCKNKDSMLKGYLTCEELRGSERQVIKAVQKNEFKQEWMNLKANSEISRKSKLISLNPILDDNELLRVGGRLSNALLSYKTKHPLILPAKHKLTDLIFKYVHKINLHVGPQTLLHFVRQEFWPINGKVIANKIVRNCIKCFRAKPLSSDQLMGDLPQERVRPSSPFNTVGVDFCGPFYVKYAGQRKGANHKIYVAILICFATKAVHLELVMSLFSEAFIACLKRFFSRRGKSAKIVSDNATNFVGANNELKKLHELVRKPDNKLAHYLSSEGIEWVFIPPGSPNYGGLWEAGVKSIKFHLKRTIGKSILTYEEFNSVVVQVEGILNSRPLIPLYSNTEIVEALTPGHFLIGRPINTIDEPEIVGLPENRLARWQRVTKMVQMIWNRWKRDYLNHLQQRYKWQLVRPNLKKGDIVIIKDNTPSLTWPLGIVQDVITGTDGKVRIVEIRTAKGITTRAVSKVCVLPSNDEESNVEN